jgi:acyl-CoA hydrolase
MTTRPAPQPVRASHIELARVMTQHDANAVGNVHGGVIMHEVDTAAGMAGARHARRVAVTASIDELSFLAPVHIGDVLVLKAAVNDVGRTSMEVGVRVEAEQWDGSERRHTTSAYLVMVAIGEDGRPVEIPPLLAETEQEQRRQAQARIRRQVRKERIARLGAWTPEPVEPDAST